jgi:hypothetical protein
MPSLGEFINNLAQKAGVAITDENLKSVLASPELATIQIHEDLAGTIDKGLLNIEAAKNNHPDIKKKYFADAFDGMDSQLIKLVEADTFDEADLAEIKAEKSTVKKAELIVSKLKAAKKADKGGNADEWNKKIADANEAARLAKEEVSKVKNDYEGKIKEIHRNAAIKAVFGNYKTIYDDLDPSIRIATMGAIINKALQDKNAVLDADDNGNLVLVAKDGSNVFGSNHVQLTPQSFLDQSFAPILKVSGPPKPASNTQQQGQNQNVSTDTKGEPSSAIKDFNAGVLASLNDPSKKVSLI